MKKTLMVAAILLCAGLAFGQDKPVNEGKAKTKVSKTQVKDVKAIAKPDAQIETVPSEKTDKAIKDDGFIKRADIGLGGGAAIYSDRIGYTGSIDTRLYFYNATPNMSFYSGAEFLYHHTKSDVHTMNNYYGFPFIGCDYAFLKNSFPSMGDLSLRAQLGIGGGYTQDKNSEGTTVGKIGYGVHPKAGFDYGFGSTHINLMYGFEALSVKKTVMTAQTVTLGFSYSIY